MSSGSLWIASLSIVLSTCSIACQAEAQTVSRHGEQAATNRLFEESSPYLLLHAHNPVDWYPWGEEAIEKARKEDKPIFLSIGYSTCYWCHVMEREVFSDPEIAQLMNQWFVNVKVDREERPDLDEVYMVATQLITRQSGGWPNSVFLTPELKPFSAGTYFSPEDRGNLMGFPTVLTRVHDAWVSKRRGIEESAERVATAMRTLIAERREPGENVPSTAASDEAVANLKKEFDAANGGFGGAPKFPSPANLFLLWDRAAARGDAEAGRMVTETLHKMGRGAIYDQIDGGFHRYTLDDRWRIPHFEKMLYDNAQLAELLTVTARATADPELERLARGTLDFVLRAMRLQEGGFKSAIDAETDGEEGAYYLWTRSELRDGLGDDDNWLAPILGFNESPNFEGGKYTLYLTDSLAEHAKRLGWSRAELLDEMGSAFDRLRLARQGREFPLVDDKVLADWNGMMIAALARGGLLLDEPRYLEAARSAASFLLANLRDGEGTLLHAWRQGRAKIPAFLDDYAFIMKGLLALYEATGENRWLLATERLAEEMERRLGDTAGGYYQTQASRHLLFQPKTIYDGAIPSGNGVATLALLSLSEHTGKTLYRERAEAAMKAFAAELEEHSAPLRTLALAVDLYHRSSPVTPRTASRSGASGKQELEPIARLAEELVKTALLLEDAPAGGGRWRPFELRVTIGEGWHVNAHPASLRYLIPTEVRGDVRKVTYPEGEDFKLAFSEELLSVYSGTVSIRGEIESRESRLRLVYQLCDDRRCLAPVDKTIPVPPER